VLVKVSIRRLKSDSYQMMSYRRRRGWTWGFRWLCESS